MDHPVLHSTEVFTLVRERILFYLTRICQFVFFKKCVGFGLKLHPGYLSQERNKKRDAFKRRRQEKERDAVA